MTDFENAISLSYTALIHLNRNPAQSTTSVPPQHRVNPPRPGRPGRRSQLPKVSHRALMYTVLNANPTLISLSLCPRERTNHNTMDTLNPLSWPPSGLDPWDYQSRGPRRAPFPSLFTHQHHLCSYPEGRGSVPELIRASES